MKLLSNQYLYEQRYLEGSVCLDLSGIECYDSEDKILQYYNILHHFKECQLDKVWFLAEKHREETIQEINDFISKYDNSGTQIKLINRLCLELDWNKRVEIQKIAEKVTFTDENALLLVKKNLDFLTCLKKVPLNVIEYIFSDDSLILNPWMHKISIIYIMKNINKINIPEVKFKAYFENYLRRIPWSLECLYQMSEEEASNYLFKAINYKFGHDYNYSYATGVKKGRLVTETMSEKEFIKFRSKDIIKLLTYFPNLITKNNLCNIIMIFPDFVKKAKDNKSLIPIIHEIITDEKFMNDFIVHNLNFCTKKRSLPLLKKLNVSEKIEKKILEKIKNRKEKKHFKY